MNTERYMITARSYPPYAAMAYRGQRLLSRDIMSDSPVRWVIDDNSGAGLTGEEALSGLKLLRSGVVLYEIRPLDAETDRRDVCARKAGRTRGFLPETEFVAPEAKAVATGTKTVTVSASPAATRDSSVRRRTAPARAAAGKRRTTRRPAGKAPRDPGRIYGLGEAAKTFGVEPHTVGKWAASWLAPAVLGRKVRMIVFDRTRAEGLVALRRHRKFCLPELPAPVGDGLLFGPKDVAGCLGIAESTARSYRRMFEPALTVRARRIEDCVWSKAKAGEIWRSHVAAVRENRRRVIMESRWDRIAPPTDGTVRGYRAAAKFIGADSSAFLHNREIFSPAVVDEKNGVRFYDPVRLKEIWTEHMRQYRRNLSEQARRTYMKIRSAAPEGAVLGNAALARALGCAKETVCVHLDELKDARTARYGREWMWDVAKAAEIWAGIQARNEEIRRAGRIEYWERRRLGLEPLPRKQGKLTKKITERDHETGHYQGTMH